MQISRSLRRTPHRLRFLEAVTLALGVLLFVASAELMAQSAASNVTAPQQPAQHKKAKKKIAKTPAAQPAAAPAPTPAPTPKPEQPNWPVNDHPSKAAVSWDSHGLHIVADNSSLQQILKEVAATTGIQIEGLSTDERIFGSYGPGPANEVLSQLLIGCGYNVMMIGEQSSGTPRQLVLSSRESGAANRPRVIAANDDDDTDEAQEPEQPTEPVQARPGQGFGGGAPRTPQQMMEDMRQRQQDQPQQSPQDGNGPEQH